MMPGELVSGSPGDTLQYLSQLEMVARKLKHQLIKQKQVGWTQQGTGGGVEPLHLLIAGRQTAPLGE